MTAPDMAIVGGGVIGCSIAYALARANSGRILVIDAGEPGGAASTAAAGVLTVASGSAPGGALFELRRAAAAMFPGLSSELFDRTGVDIEYRKGALLKLAFSDKEEAELRALTAKRREQGFDAEWLAPESLCRLEPGVSTEVHGGVHFGAEGAVNNQRLVEALRLAAQRLGVDFRFGCRVSQVEISAGRVLALVAGGERR